MLVLKEGSRGSEVKRLQLLLNARSPSPHLRIDGDFGRATKQAVIAFQKAERLAVDGIVGAKTWAALGQAKVSQLIGEVTMCTAGEPWMEIAALEKGIQEDARPGHHDARILAYHQTTTLRATTDEVPWCSSFVNWVMTQAGYRGTNSALAKSWLVWGQAIITPRYGAIAVIKRRGARSDVATGSSTGYHVGFCIMATAAEIRLLGGNQGDAVRYSNFSLSAYSLEGCRWPL